MLLEKSLQGIECPLRSLLITAWASSLTLDFPPHSALSTDAGPTSSNAAALYLSMESSDLATILFDPLPSEALTLNLPQPDEERTLQEWCSSELVSLPSMALPASNGTVLPLNKRGQDELSDHLRSGHSSKSNLRRGCLQAEGPRKVHRAARDIDKRLTLFTLTLDHFRRKLHLLPSWRLYVFQISSTQ